MQELQCASKVVYESAKGPILCIAFRGYFPPGSADTIEGKPTSQYVRQLAAKHCTAAVMFDLTGLDYVWGDSILSIVLPFWDRKFPVTKPMCVVATGRTAEALQPFFDPLCIWGLLGVKFFDSLDDGLIYLKNRLAEPSA